MYELILGINYNQDIGMDILNGDLDFSWYELQVTIVYIGYYNYTMINNNN